MGAASKRLLVIDDNSDILEALGELLRTCGHEVVLFTSAKQALETITALHPDAVICDIAMPEMDGWTFAKQVRANPATREILLIALTGLGRPADKDRSRQVGFDAHLVKPWDISKLAHVVEQH